MRVPYNLAQNYQAPGPQTAQKSALLPALLMAAALLLYVGALAGLLLGIRS